jgi:hypothetical protein
MRSGKYVYVRVEGKWILEHRHMMSIMLGRPLGRHEKVRHLDGNLTNNDPANLELRMVRQKDPSGIRAADYHCPGCRCFEAPRVRYVPS